MERKWDHMLRLEPCRGESGKWHSKMKITRHCWKRKVEIAATLLKQRTVCWQEEGWWAALANLFLFTDQGVRKVAYGTKEGAEGVSVKERKTCGREEERLRNSMEAAGWAPPRAEMETSSREAGEWLAPKCPEKNQEELETVGGDEGHKIKSQTKCSKRTFGIDGHHGNLN